MSLFSFLGTGISSLSNVPKGTNNYLRSDFAYGFTLPKVSDLKK
jgi:hypothetical protein